jgi:hypothetical protein
VLALGLLDGVSDPAPTADFDAEFTEAGDVERRHAQGDSIAGDPPDVPDVRDYGTALAGRC